MNALNMLGLNNELGHACMHARVLHVKLHQRVPIIIISNDLRQWRAQIPGKNLLHLVFVHHGSCQLLMFL